MTHSLLGNPVDTKADCSPEARGKRGRLGLIRCLKRITAIMTSMSGGSVFQDWKGNRNTLEKRACCQIQSDPGLKGNWKKQAETRLQNKVVSLRKEGQEEQNMAATGLLPHKLGRPNDLLQATSSAHLAEFTRASVLNRSSRQQV